jgi:hypothetical protein
MAVVAEAPTTSNSSIHPVTYEKEVVFQHSVILINVGQSVAEKDSYEAVRYAWVLDKKRAEKTEYVLAVDHGLIIDVFIAERWLRATPDNFPRIAPDWPAWKVPRWGFVGRPAPTEIAEHYKHSWVPASMRKPGGRNPIRYANKSGPLA